MRTLNRRNFVCLAAGALTATSTPAGIGAEGVFEAPLGFVPDPKFLQRAERLLAAHPAIDLHAHPGDSFLRGARDLTPEVQAISGSAPTEQRAVSDMEAGGMAGGSFAAVGDLQILGMRDGKLGWVREFRPGEARSSYETQMANLREWVPKAGAVVALTPKDILELHGKKKIAALLSVEGGDFLENDASYIQKAFADGVRILTLVHYHPNELGDNQTAEPRSGGLTDLGREVVQKMDQVGMVIDIAHASDATVRGVLKSTRNPVICSHTVLSSPQVAFPRFISAGLAREITAHGGVIGAWPAGFGATTMSDYVERIFELRRVVGPEFVAFGSDMDANYKPVLSSYRQVPLLVSELLRRGYGTTETIAFLGGNFLRVFKQVWSGRIRGQTGF